MNTQPKKTNRLVISAIALFLVIVFGLAAMGRFIPAKKSTLAGMNAIVYRSPSCGCCGNYISYLRGLGIIVEERLENDMAAVRKQHNIPDSLASCHTTEIGGYTVEGHIPVEAIEKLIAEKPSVAGIGLGDMPAGSPGMPGAKAGLFEISEFTADGSMSLFVNI